MIASMRNRMRTWLFASFFLLGATALFAAPVPLIAHISSKGSERLPPDFIAEELGLRAGTSVSEDALIQARKRLLGTGLFRSAQFFLKKGADPQHLDLEIELEDDPSILGPWAWGSSLALTQGQNSTLASSINPLSINAQLVSRNLFTRLHRAALQIDADNSGRIRGLQMAYGLPRFAAEDVQFDANLEAADPDWRYLDVLGFAAKGQLMWTVDQLQGWQYGVALYSNQQRRMKLEGMPQTVAGPRIGWQKESRLLGFRTSEGYSYRAAAVVTTRGFRRMAYELGAAYTLDLWPAASLTVQSDVLSVGFVSSSVRSLLRWEQGLPIWKEPGDPLLYVQASQGSDHYRDTSLDGRELRLGFRIHSPGLIADLALAISSIPERFDAAQRGGP